MTPPRRPRRPKVSPALADRAAALTADEIIPVLAEGLDWHADRADIDRVLHYTHWIPVQRGFTAAFLNETWPGWTMATLVAVFDAAGIRQLPGSGRPGAPHGGRCHWRVKTLHFNGRNEFVVEWNDLVGDDDRFTSQDATGPRIPAWAEARRAELIARARATDPGRFRPVDLSGRQFFDDDSIEPRRDA